MFRLRRRRPEALEMKQCDFARQPGGRLLQDLPQYVRSAGCSQIQQKLVPLSRRRIERSIDERLVPIPAKTRFNVTRGSLIEDLQMHDFDTVSRQQLVEIVEQRADDRRGTQWVG